MLDSQLMTITTSRQSVAIKRKVARTINDCRSLIVVAAFPTHRGQVNKHPSQKLLSGADTPSASRQMAKRWGCTRLFIASCFGPCLEVLCHHFWRHLYTKAASRELSTNDAVHFSLTDLLPSSV